MRRKPQCTTSWSSTTRTRSRLSAPPPALSRLGLTSGTPKRHRQPYAPDPRLALAELDAPARLTPRGRGEPHPHPARGPRAAVHAVVADLHHERAVDPPQRHVDLRRLGVLR